MNLSLIGTPAISSSARHLQARGHDANKHHHDNMSIEDMFIVTLLLAMHISPAPPPAGPACR